MINYFRIDWNNNRCHKATASHLFKNEYKCSLYRYMEFVGYPSNGWTSFLSERLIDSEDDILFCFSYLIFFLWGVLVGLGEFIFWAVEGGGNGECYRLPWPLLVPSLY